MNDIAMPDLLPPDYDDPDRPWRLCADPACSLRAPLSIIVVPGDHYHRSGLADLLIPAEGVE